MMAFVCWFGFFLFVFFVTICVMGSMSLMRSGRFLGLGVVMDFLFWLLAFGVWVWCRIYVVSIASRNLNRLLGDNLVSFSITKLNETTWYVTIFLGVF